MKICTVRVEIREFDGISHRPFTHCSITLFSDPLLCLCQIFKYSMRNEGLKGGGESPHFLPPKPLDHPLPTGQTMCNGVIYPPLTHHLSYPSFFFRTTILNHIFQGLLSFWLLSYQSENSLFLLLCYCSTEQH